MRQICSRSAGDLRHTFHFPVGVHGIVFRSPGRILRRPRKNTRYFEESRIPRPPAAVSASGRTPPCRNSSHKIAPLPSWILMKIPHEYAVFRSPRSNSATTTKKKSVILKNREFPARPPRSRRRAGPRLAGTAHTKLHLFLHEYSWKYREFLMNTRFLRPRGRTRRRPRKQKALFIGIENSPPARRGLGPGPASEERLTQNDTRSCKWGKYPPRRVSVLLGGYINYQVNEKESNSRKYRGLKLIQIQ